MIVKLLIEEDSVIKEYLGNDGSVAEHTFAIIVSKYHHSITSKLLDKVRATEKMYKIADHIS